MSIDSQTIFWTTTCCQNICITQIESFAPFINKQTWAVLEDYHVCLMYHHDRVSQPACWRYKERGLRIKDAHVMVAHKGCLDSGMIQKTVLTRGSSIINSSILLDNMFLLMPGENVWFMWMLLMMIQLWSSNGLLPDGTKPLPDPVSTQSCTIWCHKTTAS